MTVTARIHKIILQQVGFLETKSETTPLSMEEISSLNVLTNALKNLRSMEREGRPLRTRGYSKGQKMTDDALIERASEFESD